MNPVFKSQHGKKWLNFFAIVNSIAANQNLYKWLLTPSGTASCDNKQFGFLGDQNAFCGNPRRTLNANPSYRQIRLMSSRQNIYQQSTQTGCHTPCVCYSGYVCVCMLLRALRSLLCLKSVLSQRFGHIVGVRPRDLCPSSFLLNHCLL